ncbi:hypothetical protein Bca4012_031121 [Brassica carinata]
MEFAKGKINGHQNVIVMRHGDRADHCEPLWASTAVRPWDPPLVHDGKTAAQVVAALSAVNLDDNAMSSKDVPSIYNSKLKVAIEFGLCEILNTVAIKSEVAPKDGKFDFKISDLQAMFPEGTVDINVGMACKELPQWEESAAGFKERYVSTLKVLADKYPSENLLLVTHWGGVGTILYKYFNDATKYLVDYCGCVELRRQISNNNESEEFEVGGSNLQFTVPNNGTDYLWTPRAAGFYPLLQGLSRFSPWKLAASRFSLWKLAATERLKCGSDCCAYSDSRGLLEARKEVAEFIE